MKWFFAFLVAIPLSYCRSKCAAWDDIQARIAKAGKLSTAEMVSLQFRDITSLPSCYPFDHPLSLDDLWLTITRKGLSLEDLWSLGLVNKHLGALVRHHKLFKEYFAFHHTPEKEMVRFLLSNELSIRWFHTRILKNECCPAFKDLNQVFCPTNQTYNQVNEVFYYVASKFLPRAYEVEIIRRLSGYSVRFDISSLEHVYQSMHNDNGSNQLRYFYLPPEGSRPLFDVVSKEIVAMTIFSGTKDYQQTFISAIIADYILGPWNKKRVKLSGDEKEMLAGIFNYSMLLFRDYFEMLNWALFFAEGKQKSRDLLAPIKKYLEEIGLTWNSLIPTRKLQFYLDHASGKQIRPLLTVAKQWGLDICKIAESRLGNNESKNICAGHLPEYLYDPKVLGASAVHRILHCDIVLRKVQEPIKLALMKTHKRPIERSREEPVPKRLCTTTNTFAPNGNFPSPSIQPHPEGPMNAYPFGASNVAPMPHFHNGQMTPMMPRGFPQMTPPPTRPWGIQQMPPWPQHFAGYQPPNSSAGNNAPNMKY